jgi:hypothetical protein
MGQTVENGPVPLAVAAEKRHRMSGVLLFDTEEVLGDDPIGLIPADGFKLALAPFPHTAQRRFNPVLPVYIVPQGGTLGAEFAMVIRVLQRALYPDDLPVFYIAVHAAVVAGAADGTQRAPHFNSGIRTGDLGLDLLL